MNGYKINEIFYSIQGEGAHAGRAAVFVRFSVCNLKCPFCDTKFETYEVMSADEILMKMQEVNKGGCTLCVLTGGEPTLQYDKELEQRLHRAGYTINMESNGTRIPKAQVDFLTISPKVQWQKQAQIFIGYPINEIKVVMDKNTSLYDLAVYAERYPEAQLFIQPCDTGFIKENKEIINRCVEFIEANPRWRLSLQTQKIINVR